MAIFNPFGGGMSAVSGGGATHTAYGTVPKPTPVPPNVYQQLSGVVPNFSAMTSATSDIIGNEQAGTVSPATLNALKTASATFGINSGMPGSGLSNNQLFANIAGWSEKQQHQGLQDYLSLLSGVGATQTPQNLAYEIAARNADLAAAPDPALAAQEQLNQWMKKYRLTNINPGGGTTSGQFGSGPGWQSGNPFAAGGVNPGGATVEDWNRSRPWASDSMGTMVVHGPGYGEADYNTSIPPMYDPILLDGNTSQADYIDSTLA